LTGSIFILKKIQNGVILIKKQKSTGCNRILPGQPGHQVGRVTADRDFFYFFFNPARFQLRVGRVSSQLAESGWVSKI
jgi:hypothetical protein